MAYVVFGNEMFSIYFFFEYCDEWQKDYAYSLSRALNLHVIDAEMIVVTDDEMVSETADDQWYLHLETDKIYFQSSFQRQQRCEVN